jgi:hypothetical protein
MMIKMYASITDYCEVNENGDVVFSFTFSKEEYEAITNFLDGENQKTYDKQKGVPGARDRGGPYYGCSGSDSAIMFDPTSLGTFVRIYHAKGKILKVDNIDGDLSVEVVEGKV